MVKTSLLGRSRSTRVSVPWSSSRGRKESPFGATAGSKTKKSTSAAFLKPPEDSSSRRTRSHEASNRRTRPVSPPDLRDHDYDRSSRPTTRRRSVSPHFRPSSPRRSTRVPLRRPRRDSSISDDSRPSSPRQSASPPHGFADRVPRPQQDVRRASLSPSRFPSTRTSRPSPPLSTHQRPAAGPRCPSGSLYAGSAAHPHPVRPSPLAESRTSSYDSSRHPVRPSRASSPPNLRPARHADPARERSPGRRRHDGIPERTKSRRSTEHSPHGNEHDRPPPQSPKVKQTEQKPKPDHEKADHGEKPAPAQASEKPQKEHGLFEKLGGAFVAYSGFEALSEHANSAKQWADWLKELRDAPEEIHSVSAKVQTAKDTITQIQNTLEARPDLVDGESGKRLHGQIDDAIESTNETLTKMTEVLQDVGESTASSDGIMGGVEEFYNSYKYRSKWEGKIKEADDELQKELGVLSTLMINLYSRAMMKPAPPGSAPVPPPAPVPDSGETKTKAKSEESKPKGEEQGPSNEDAGRPRSATATGLDPPPVPQLPKTHPGSAHAGSPTPPNTAKGKANAEPTPPNSANTTPNPSEEKPRPPKTPEDTLLDAAWDGDVNAVVEALRTTPVTTCDDRGFTPLHLAAERDHLATVMLLLDRGADINARANGGRTPLHLAARFASAATVELLIDDGHAHVNACTKDGRTPLHYAASAAQDGDQERREVVRLLRDWGADPTMEDSRGETPRDVAQKRDFWDTAATLRRAEKRWEEDHKDHKEGWFQRHGFRK